MPTTHSFNSFFKNIFLLSFFFLTITTLSAQPYSIGHISKTFIDASRNNREIITEIYFPADENMDNIPVANECFPIISFGHGFVMMSGAYQNIWEAVVTEGYIMVFVDTETGFNVNHGAYGLDLAFVVDEMLNSNTTTGDLFENSVCGKNVVMGHSMGGGASVLATNNSNNIDGYVGLASAETSPSAIAAAANTTVPSLIFSGTSDGVTPPAEHHIPIYNGFNSNCKTIINLIGGAHCYFANEDLLCDIGEGAASTGITLTRAEQQTIMIDYLIPWLQYLNVTQDFEPIEIGLSIDDRVTSQTTCFTTNTQDIIEIDFVVYPNPTADIISISEIPSELIGEYYTIVDVLGKQVLNGQIASENFAIDISALNAGVYYFLIDGINTKNKISKL